MQKLLFVPNACIDVHAYSVNCFTRRMLFFLNLMIIMLTVLNPCLPVCLGCLQKLLGQRDELLREKEEAIVQMEETEQRCEAMTAGKERVQVSQTPAASKVNQ